MSFFTKARGILNRPVSDFFKRKHKPVKFTLPDPVLPIRQKRRTGKLWALRRGGKTIILTRRPAGVRKWPANGVKP